jgi:23S rRNA (adenine2503-C2)-methyltransferase
MSQAHQPDFRAAQLFRWIHARRAARFSEMSDLPAELRADLERRFSLDRLPVVHRAVSGDGSVKYGLELQDGAVVEAVFIPDGARRTLCLSSQVGCRFGCTFCATARMGLVRHLGAGEIVGQAMALIEPHELSHGSAFNVVFMGMGEPMDNLEAVLEAFEILTDPDGFGLSWRRVTVSTAGHVEGIARLAARPHRPRLAVSLNATQNEIRTRLMPITRKWPLEELKAALLAYPLRQGERLTFEYVLLTGENDSPADARRLAGLLHGLRARVNLIPWNPFDAPGHARPTLETVETFRDALLGRGCDATIRFSRGEDVMAACGQLATAPSR